MGSGAKRTTLFGHKIITEEESEAFFLLPGKEAVKNYKVSPPWNIVLFLPPPIFWTLYLEISLFSAIVSLLVFKDYFHTSGQKHTQNQSLNMALILQWQGEATAMYARANVQQFSSRWQWRNSFYNYTELFTVDQGHCHRYSRLDSSHFLTQSFA